MIKQLVESGVLSDSDKTDRQTDRQTEKHTIDLCVMSPREIEVANCIKARYDAGISNLQADGSGVLEQQATSNKQQATSNKQQATSKECRIVKTVSMTKLATECQVTDCAATLLARDYKGPGNFAKTNGAIIQQNVKC